MSYTVFGAVDATDGSELFGTDGTTYRTTEIKSINPTSTGSNATNSAVSGGYLPFAVIGNYAYFSADDGTNGTELWRTDGTTGGTTKVTEFSTDSGTAGIPGDDVFGYNPSNIVAANGYIFFIGSGPAASNPSTSAARYGVWKYDPVGNTTTFIANNDGINGMVSTGSRVYWTYDSATSGMKSSDGVGAVVDITGNMGLNGAPGNPYVAGSSVYMTYNGGTKKIDGTTVVNVTGGPTQPSGFIAAGTNVYIIGSTNALYVTTTSTTTATAITTAGLTFDFNYNPGYSQPGFAALGTKLIFSNNHTSASGVGGATGSEVWITDGTGAGTTLLKDIVAGIGNSNPHNFITVGSNVFFQATNGYGSVELWKTDGTAGGTVLVDTLFAGGLSSGSGQVITSLNMDNMSVQNGVLYFSFDDQVHGNELWRSDGTALGTAMVRDINTGTIDTGYSNSYTNYAANLGATGVFVGWSQATGYELFSTDGTAGGTALLKDIDPGGGNSLPGQLTVAGTKAYFTAYDPTHGTELWVTDGTAAGTVIVKDINPGLGGSTPSGMVAVGSTVYFSANNGVNGQELWKTDGTTAGTVMVADIDTTSSGGFPNSGSPYGFVAAGSNVFFTAHTNATGTELWVTDGTAGGTHITKDIASGAGDAQIYSPLLSYNGKVYFQANDGTNGTELWVSDGTSGGTVMLKNIDTTAGEGSNPSDFQLANGKFFFRASGVNPFAGAELYVSDGTSGGTVAVSPTLTNFSNLAVANNKVFFTAQGSSGQELYVSSGASATLIDIVSGVSGSNASNPIAFGTKVLFTAQDTTAHGTELWISDGTAGGTAMLKDINTNPNGSSNPQYITVVGSKAYFVADDGSNGQELWVTDGTTGGTQLVKNIGPGSTGGSVSPLKAVDSNHLLFLASDGVHGQELWITDGTNAGTFMATDVVQAAGSFYTSSGTSLNGGGAPKGTFASVPGVTLGGGDENAIDGTPDADYLNGLGGNDTINGLGGDDVIIATSGNDTAHGGDGNDALYFGSAFGLGDVADGGPGSDQLGLQGDYSAGLTLGAGMLVNIETLVLLPGNDTRFGDTSGSSYSYNLTTDNANVAAGQVLTVNFNTLRSGENVTFNGAAETDGSFLMYGGQGIDHLTGGQQADGFFFGVNSAGLRFGASDTIDGQGGSDQVALYGNYSGGSAIVLGATQLVSVETLVLLSGADTRFGNGALSFSYTVTSNDGNVANGQTLTINANTLASGETLSFNGAAELDGSFRIFSGAGSDTLVGGAGNDTIYGAAGADTLTGGAGNDTFAYVSAAHSTSASRDHITDFTAGDLIDLSAIDAIAATTGTNDAFTFIGTAAFGNHAGELRYVASASDWLVQGDTNGDGVADFEVLVTTTGGHTPAIGDFVL